MINLTINNIPVSVAEGTTVLQAARQNGIKIPTLCDHPYLTPYGGCRLCIVEVEGMRAPTASCTLPAAEGMRVQTDTPDLRQSRQTILNLLFSERNHFCPFCQVSGNDCELQQAAYGQGLTHWDIQPQWHNFPVDTSHPYFILDHNRCILCRRCLRACAEMSANFTISVEERGAATLIIADNGVPFGESSCVSCGSCVQACPTGALIDRQSAYLGQNVHLDVTRSVCAGCSVGCGVTIHTRNNRIVKINGDWEAFNGGTLCKLGRFIPLEMTSERITTPLVRRDGKLAPASWEAALSAATEGLAKGKPAAYISSRLPVETLYMFKQLFASGEAPPAREIMEGKIEALRNADCILVLGVDLAKTHEVLGFFVKRNMHKGAKLIVIDSAANTWDELADIAIKPASGEDLIAALAAIVRQVGIDSPATGSPAREGLMAAAQMLTSAAAPVIIFDDLADPASLLDLAGLTGVIGANRSGLLSVKGNANALAAARLGLNQSFAPDGAPCAYLALGDELPDAELLSKVEGVPFLVVQSAYKNALTERADVVLPAAAWAEEEGHYLSLDGRLQTASAALVAPGEARNNTAILASLAQMLGVKVSDDWQAAIQASLQPQG